MWNKSKKSKKKTKKNQGEIIMAMLLSNWEYILLAVYVIEKIVKLSPSKKDDVIFDMIIKPIVDKIKSR